jgi:hypothetical protein
MNRAEHDLAIPFGAIVHDQKGHRWACVGTERTTVGLSYRFVQESIEHPNYRPHFDYVVSMTGTLLTKFPDAERYLKVHA